MNCGIDLGYNEGTPFYRQIVPTFPTADDLIELVGYNQYWKLGLNIGLAGHFNLKNTKLNIGSGVQPYKIFEAKRPIEPEGYIPIDYLFSQTRYFHINWVSSLGLNLIKVSFLDFVAIEYAKGLTNLVHNSTNFKYKFFGIKLTKHI